MLNADCDYVNLAIHALQSHAKQLCCCQPPVDGM